MRKIYLSKKDVTGKGKRREAEIVGRDQVDSIVYFTYKSS